MSSTVLFNEEGCLKNTLLVSVQEEEDRRHAIVLCHFVVIFCFRGIYTHTNNGKFSAA